MTPTEELINAVPEGTETESQSTDVVSDVVSEETTETTETTGITKTKKKRKFFGNGETRDCLLYTSPSPRDS